MAQDYSFDIDQGSTHTFSLTYKDSSGNAVDLSSHTPQMDVRDKFLNDTGSNLLFSLTDGDGIDTTNASTGTLAITINATRSALLVDAEYRYDLEIEDSGVITRLIQGKISVKKQVTD